jgi:hypothetical protein
MWVICLYNFMMEYVEMRPVQKRQIHGHVLKSLIFFLCTALISTYFVLKIYTLVYVCIYFSLHVCLYFFRIFWNVKIWIFMNFEFCIWGLHGARPPKAISDGDAVFLVRWQSQREMWKWDFFYLWKRIWIYLKVNQEYSTFLAW